MYIKEESRQTRRALFSLLLFGPLSFSFSQNRKIQGLKNLEQEQNMENLAMHMMICSLERKKYVFVVIITRYV